MQLEVDRALQRAHREWNEDLPVERISCRWVGLKRLGRAKGTTAALQIDRTKLA